jgi:hypothetical protein
MLCAIQLVLAAVLILLQAKGEEKVCISVSPARNRSCVFSQGQSQMVLTGLTGLQGMRHFCFDTVVAPQSELSLPLLQDSACE